MSAPDPQPVVPRRPSLLERVGLGRPELRAWALYDWANSAMVTTVITAVFPIYYQEVAAQGVDSDTATARFTLATTISLAVVALLALPLGRWADVRATRKRGLGACLILGVVAVGSLFFVREGDWMAGLVLFGLANAAAGVSFLFYDALLPHVARPDEVDRVSTAGYALGYVGGGLLLALNLAWIQKPEWFGLENAHATLPARLAFLSVAVWWAGFALPLFRHVPEPPPSGEARGEGLADTLRKFASTVREIFGYRQAALFLIAFLIYNDGILTIIRVATLYGKGLGLDSGDMILTVLLVQFGGIPCAFLFGEVAGRIGAKRSILFALLVYVGIAVLGYSMQTRAHFFLLGGLVALVQGGAQALSRSLFSTLVPRQRSAEFFALFAVGEKFAGIAGPLFFYLVLAGGGESRFAVLGVSLFFLVGGALLLRVDVDEGRRVARAAEAEAAAEAGSAAG